MTIRPKKGFVKKGFEGVSDNAFQYYNCGDFFGGEDWAEGKSEEELRAFWDEHKKVIIARCLEENKKRGWVANRPWVWWIWEMVEPQRPVPPGQFEANKVWDHKKREFGWVESDFEYLKRLNLLEPWELEQNK